MNDKKREILIPIIYFLCRPNIFMMDCNLIKKGFLVVLPLILGSCASEQLRENTVTTGSTTSDLLYEMALSNVAMVRYFNGVNSDNFKQWNNKNPVFSSNQLNDTNSVYVGVLPEDPTPLGTKADKKSDKKANPKAAAAVKLTHVPIDDTRGDTLPWAYDISGANIAVNDSEGITGGIGADMSSMHVFHPSLSIPLSRALQQSWAVTPVTDTIALNLLKGYYYDASVAKHLYGPHKGEPLFRSGDPAYGCLKGSYRDQYVWISNDDPEALANLTHLVQKVMAAIEDADQRAGARKTGNSPVNTTQPQVFIQHT